MQIFVYPYPQCEPSDDYVSQIAHDHYMDTEDVVIPTEMLFYEDYDVIYITRKQTEKHDKPENESENVTNPPFVPARARALARSGPRPRPRARRRTAPA